MANTPCCWATNELSRDKENYIRCATYNANKGKADKNGKKGKNDKNMCCAAAFRQQMEQEDEIDRHAEIDANCAPADKKKKKPKVDKDKFRCFTANMICMRLYMPGREFECPSQLIMVASVCKGCKPIICSDRMNVNCLPATPSAKFTMLPECLDKELTQGIQISVKYLKKEIGRGCYVLPDSVILRMTTTFEEVVHTAEVELTCKGCTVGICTVRLSMRMQCQVLADDNNCDDSDSCGDLLADESGSEETSDPCQGFTNTYDDDDDNEDAVCPSSEPNKRRNKGGCNEGGRLIDMAGPYNMYSCESSEDGCLRVEARPGAGGQFSMQSRSHLGEANTNRLCITASAPHLKQMGVLKGHTCLMCHEDVSWLPMIAACPHCGYKEVPAFEEKDYDEKATAKDILVDFFQRTDIDENSESACSPVDENVNTEDAFDTIVHDYKSLKQSIKKCQTEQPCPDMPRESRKTAKPNMVSVFSDLKKLFEVGGTEEDKKAKIQEICDEACKLAKGTKRRIRRSKGKSTDICGDLRNTKGKQVTKSKVYEAMETYDYPRNRHTHCYEHESKVPAHMGWLWTHHPLAQQTGWRPGAIRRSIRELMGYFLKDYPVDSVPLSKYLSYHKQKPKTPHVEGEKPEELVQVPTLHIEKKHDEYLITLRPLKDADSLKRAANPYVNMKPVQFRIVKDPYLKKMREMKRCLKKMGFSKCTCHRPVMECYCRSFIDKKLLMDEVERQCQKRQLECCEDELVLSDTTDSEAEFDFGVTPPAGLMKPERLKVTNMTNTETQYNESDWAMPTMFPQPPNANVQYASCVMGERKKEFSWIMGKGNVHAKPKKPKMRNKPKKKPKKPFPGAPEPREKGGFTSANQPHHAHSENQLDPSHRLQRLQRAAHPPTARQFQERHSQLSLPSKKVQFIIPGQRVGVVA